MQRTYLAVLTALLTAMPAAATAGAHAPLSSALNPGAVSVSVVQLAGGASLQNGAGAAVAELGTVSSNVRFTSPGVAIVRHSQSYVVVTEIGLRANTSGPQRTVSLQGFLDTDMPGITVRIDGVTLSGIPHSFAVRIPVNVVTRHRLEVEIPNSLDPARVPAEIPLEFGATAD